MLEKGQKIYVCVCYDTDKFSFQESKVISVEYFDLPNDNKCCYFKFKYTCPIIGKRKRMYMYASANDDTMIDRLHGLKRKPLVVDTDLERLRKFILQGIRAKIATLSLEMKKLEKQIKTLEKQEIDLGQEI